MNGSERETRGEIKAALSNRSVFYSDVVLTSTDARLRAEIENERSMIAELW